MNIAEQIKANEATRMAKAARQQEIMTKAAETGETLDEAQAEEFDGLSADIEAIDKNLVRLRIVEKNAVAQARALPSQTTQRSATDARGGSPTIIVRSGERDEDFKGQNFTRRMIAKALAHLSGSPFSYGIAQDRWGKSAPTLVQLIKANEVAGGGSGSGEWGAELVAADGRYTGDFIEYLRQQTLFWQLPLREVPANVTIKGQDGGGTANWVGQSKAIPASALDFSSVNLSPLKVAALAVCSNELLRDSSPAAEQLIRDDLVKAAAQRIDSTFFSAAAASAGVSPAGILNGVSPSNSTGSDADGVIADLENLLEPFLAAYNASGLVICTNKTIATKLSMMRNALGQREFPDMTPDGGMLMGYKAYAGDNVAAGDLILLKPSDIWRIGAGTVEVMLSREATIEQNSVPTGASDTPTAASATLVSMFQEDSTAFRILQSVNFQKRRTHAAQYVDDAAYGGASS